MRTIHYSRLIPKKALIANLNIPKTAINKSRSIQSFEDFQDQNVPLNQIHFNQDISKNINQRIQFFDQWLSQSANFLKVIETKKQLLQLTNFHFFSLILRDNSNPISGQNSAINDEILKDLFSKLSCGKEYIECLRRIVRSVSQILLIKIDFDFQSLRALLILFYIPQLYEANFSQTFKSLIKLIGKFSVSTRSLLIEWLRKLPNLIFIILNKCHEAISLILSQTPKGQEWLSSINPFTNVISLLFEANKNCSRQLPLYSFQNIGIDSRINCRRMTIFPFVLSFPSRLKVARLGVQDLHSSSKMVSMLTGRDAFLELNIHRAKYYEESKAQLFKKNSYDFLKRLKVNFIGEVAVDAGGPQRELLCMLTNHIVRNSLELLNNRVLWFKKCDLSDMFFLGLIIGISISNEITLPIKFPSVLYSKLFDENFVPTIDDFAELDPIAARSLKQIIEMKSRNEDISSLYLTFDVSLDSGKTVPLLQSMSDVVVNNGNCIDYVNVYIEWAINRRYSDEFESFKKGFMMSCPNNYIKLLTPSEFDKIVSGCNFYNWTELKNEAVYNDNLTCNSERIIWFWDIFDKFSDRMKLDFLKFTTGMENLPFHGLKTIRIKFHDGGNSDKLPYSFTCFNMFFIPNYKNKKQLKEKLILALQFSEGFGMK